MATYDQIVIADAPLAYFRLDSTSGTTEANVGTLGGTGTIAGTGFTRGQTGVGTVAGSAFKLPNATAASTITSASLTVTDYTMEIWYKRDTAFSGSATTGLMYIVGTNTVELTVNRGTGYFRVFDGALNDGPTDATIIDGNWHHLVVTKAGTAVKWYKDGAEVYTGTSAAATRTAYTGRVASPTNANHHPSWIDEPAIYNRALAPAEVLEHYNAAFAAQVVNVSVAAPVVTSSAVAVNALNTQVGVTAPVVTSSVTAPNANVTAVDIWHNTVQATADGDLFNVSGSGNDLNLSFYGTGQGAIQKALYFNFPDPRLTGTVIESLTFKFNVSATNGPLTYRVDRITSSWVETQETQPTKTTTGVTSTISATGDHTVTLTGAALAGWNTGSPWYGIALSATSTGGDATIASSENTTFANRPTMESQLASNAVDISVAAPVVTSTATAKDAVVTAVGNRINTAPPVTSSISAVAGTSSAQRNITVAAPVVTGSVLAKDANVVVINPDVTNAAPPATSTVISKDASVVAGVSVEVEGTVATATSTAVAGSFTNVTNINILAPTVVSNGRGISTYDRTQDRYVAYVPYTVDADDIWYQMEEQSGTVAFDNVFVSGLPATPGAYVGTPEFSVEGPQFRKAVHFSGDDYLNINYTSSQFSVLESTLEFSIRTTQQNGVLFSNLGKTSISLVNGEMIIGDRTSPYTNRVRKNIADGNWHHVVISTPTYTFTLNRPFFVMIDGQVEFRRNETTYASPGLPATAMALYNRNTPTVPATEHVVGDMRDLIVRTNYAVSIDTAQKLYYEWSNTVVITADPAKTTSTAVAGTGKGNIKKLLAIYGLPYTLDRFYGELMNYKSVFAGFYIETYNTLSQLDNGQRGWGPVKPFYLNDYLVYPVSITGREPSADGVGSREFIDPWTQFYIDDRTGTMRFIDLDRDLIGPVTEYDALTVVNYPAFTPTDDVRMGDLNQKSYGLTNGQWTNIRDGLRDSILDAAAQGVNLWIPEPEMATHLGFIQGYDVHPTGNWQQANGGMGVTSFPNKAAAVIDNLHLSTGNKIDVDSVGQTFDYSATFQANYFRRIVGLEEGLTDIPAYIRQDTLYQYRYDRFHGYADVNIYDIADRRSGLQLGDRVAMNMKDAMNTAGGTGDMDPVGVIEARQGGRKSIVSARPDGIVGKVIAREMEWYYGPSGSIVQNPFRSNAITIVAERGTTVNGVTIRGRAFMEFMDSATTTSVVKVDRYQDAWLGVRNKNVTTWSYDNRRNGPYNGNTVSGSWIPVTDDLPTITMNGRGLKWLAAAGAIPEGDVRVYGATATSDIEAKAATITKIRNIVINATPATSNVEVREPYDPNRPDVLIRAEVATSEIRMNGTGVVIMAPPVTSEVITPSAAIEADKERIYVTVDSSRYVTLFMKED